MANEIVAVLIFMFAFLKYQTSCVNNDYCMVIYLGVFDILEAISMIVCIF